MPILTLTWVDGQPRLDLDGNTVARVSLATIEVEAGSLPSVHIEITPEVVTHLGEGVLSWNVMCPSCEMNHNHKCDLETGKLISEELQGELVIEDRTIGGRTYPVAVPPPPHVFDVNRDGNVELYREMRYEDLNEPYAEIEDLK